MNDKNSNISLAAYKDLEKDLIKYSVWLKGIKEKLKLESVGYFCYLNDIQFISGKEMTVLITNGIGAAISDDDAAQMTTKLLAILPWSVSNKIVSIWRIYRFNKLPNHSRLFNCKFHGSIEL